MNFFYMQKFGLWFESLVSHFKFFLELKIIYILYIYLEVFFITCEWLPTEVPEKCQKLFVYICLYTQ